ncbi:MAG: hypothetical protein IPG17_06865 [Sandaracinaceae bacterium]|nr:hypothetical protein [Sandaracinaceae bacterium]
MTPRALHRLASAVRLALTAGVLVGAWGLAATEARACATCSVGDRTLTSMGAAQPYPNRVRLFRGPAAA